MASTTSPRRGSQRERLLSALAESCATRGYGATTIAAICGPAGVSRATFYELFRDKEDCMRAAMELSLAEATSAVASAQASGKGWAELVRDTAASLLELLAGEPAYARMALVEAPSAGPDARALHTSGLRVLEAVLERGRRQPETALIPASTARAALAAAESLVVGWILAGETARLPELLPDVVYIVTVPYLGQEAALHAAEHPTPALGRS
ncbi:MAG TPA: TetR/AcrR family transcriptional regulator [Solirubrobacterales bacterium]